MADEKHSDKAGAAARATGTQGVRMVKCVKFGREMPGLDRVPWKGEIGKRIYDNVSKEAWKLWVEHSKMLMNEFRLNPLDPNSQKVMEEQMEPYFFGEGAKLPDSYVSPKHVTASAPARPWESPLGLTFSPPIFSAYGASAPKPGLPA